MKYPYTLQLVDIYDPSSIILELPDEVALFGAFLFDAITSQGQADSCIGLIEKVINNEMDSAEFFGDIYRVVITRGTTRVEDIVDYDEYHSEMRTADFEDLIGCWMEEKRKLA